MPTPGQSPSFFLRDPASRWIFVDAPFFFRRCVLFFWASFLF
jgi:hypothetical protein